MTDDNRVSYNGVRSGLYDPKTGLDIPGGVEVSVWRYNNTYYAHPEPLNPRTDLFRHSDKFEFGYGGAGPAQLALAILADFTGDDALAVAAHMDFKWQVISQIRQSEYTGFVLTGEDVRFFLDKWMAEHPEKMERIKIERSFSNDG